MEDIQLFNGDCLEVMDKLIEEGVKVDMVLCDPPYGTTASKWDNIVSFEEMWDKIQHLVKPNGAVVLFSSGSYTFKLIESNLKQYKYKWIWAKKTFGNFVNAKNRPLTSYEEVCVFSKGNTANGSKNKMVYYPQGLIPCNKVIKHGDKNFGSMAGKRPSHKTESVREFTNYPNDIISFTFREGEIPNNKRFHPNQKPIDLLEYLIKTYTVEGETVLDFTMGSGSTGIACVNTNRKFIGIELDKNYFDIANKRILGD